MTSDVDTPVEKCSGDREKNKKKATREVRADRREVHLSLPVGKTWSEGVVSGMTVGECTELCVYVYMTAATDAGAKRILSCFHRADGQGSKPTELQKKKKKRKKSHHNFAVESCLKSHKPSMEV